MKKRFVELDSLRGIAVVGIAFFWHFRHFGLSDVPYHAFFSWFYTSVWRLIDLLFAISGFVSMHAYAQHVVTHKVSFGNFLVRRLRRLYPLHIFTLLLVSVLLLLRMVVHLPPFVFSENNTYHFFLNLFLLHGGMFEHALSFNAPSWAVSTEMGISVVFFFLLSKTVLRTAWFLVMVFLGMVMLQQDFILPFFNGNMAHGLISFFLGCITYSIHEMIMRVPIRIKNGFMVIVVLLCILGFIWHLFFIFFALVVLLALHNSVIQKALILPPVVFVGKLSYSIYLLHFPVQLTLDTVTKYFSITLSSYGIFYLSVVSTIVVSWLSYRYLEKPLGHLL